MYFKRLYKISKWWFAAVVLFVTAQLALNIRQDVAVSPVYHYGMYSEVILPDSQYRVTEITVNNKKLQTKKFSAWQWDRISQPVTLYAKQKEWNSYVWNTDIKRLLHVSDSGKYVNALLPAAFNDWYKNYLQQMLDEKIDSISIDIVDYNFNGIALYRKDVP